MDPGYVVGDNGFTINPQNTTGPLILILKHFLQHLSSFPPGTLHTVVHVIHCTIQGITIQILGNTDMHVYYASF